MATEHLITPNEVVTDQDEINWLEGHDMENWKTVTFKGDMSDPRQRDEKEKIIRAYIRGWLELYNDDNSPKHRLTRVEIRNNYGGDTRFTVKAFIEPPPSVNALVEGISHDLDSTQSPKGGAHLIPHPPPPPE